MINLSTGIVILTIKSGINLLFANLLSLWVILHMVKGYGHVKQMLSCRTQNALSCWSMRHAIEVTSASSCHHHLNGQTSAMGRAFMSPDLKCLNKTASPVSSSFFLIFIVYAQPVVPFIGVLIVYVNIQKTRKNHMTPFHYFMTTTPDG